jgi:Na+(H+)/acetate symporter ActP
MIERRRVSVRRRRPVCRAARQRPRIGRFLGLVRVDQATAEMGKPVDDPSLTFILRASYLVLAPVLAGLAASTALRAVLYAGCALYLMPAASFSWDLIQQLLAGEGPPSASVIINWVRTMLGSAVAGGVLGLLAYGVKRLVGKAVALARR